MRAPARSLNWKPVLWLVPMLLILLGGAVLSNAAAPAAASGSPAKSPAQSAGLSAPRIAGDEKWVAGFGPIGVNGIVTTMVRGAGSDVYVGGLFSSAGDVLANNVAKWNGTSWSVVGNGIAGMIYALAWDGTTLYAGGDFNYTCTNPACTARGTTQLRHLAKWNGSSWSAVGYGVDGTVYALALDATNDLYVGGAFYNYCNDDGCGASTLANNVAKWSPSGPSWSLLGADPNQGTNNDVRALAWDTANGILYVGGYFTRAANNSVFANHIAIYKPAPSDNWSVMNDATRFGVSQAVLALAYETGSLYVGGDFSMFCSNPDCSTATTHANHIARWDTSSATWNLIVNGVNAPVYALALDYTPGHLYVGGPFYGYCNDDGCTTSSSAGYAVKWTDGGTWSALGTGMNAPVNALVLNGSNVYAGGLFSTAGGTLAPGIAKWTYTPSPGTWSALGPTTGKGLGPLAKAAVADGKGNVYVGGNFHMAGGALTTNIARWNGTTWSSLQNGLVGTVYSLTVDKDGNLYAGGDLNGACGNPECATVGGILNGVAKWTPSGDSGSWSQVGMGLWGTVDALTVDKDNVLYAGGEISDRCTADDCSTKEPVHNVVKWTGSAWVTVGSGIKGTVRSLASDKDGNLYAGGSFTALCGDPDCATSGTSVNRIAKWDKTSWLPLQNGVNDTVWSVAVDRSGVLYAGGAMTNVCTDSTCSLGTMLNGTGRWDSTSWSKVGNGFDFHMVDALLVDDSNHLFAAGLFTNACADGVGCPAGTPVNSIAIWNGTGWSPLGSGIGPLSVYGGPVALAWQYGRLSVAGFFSSAGDKLSANFAQYQDNNPPVVSNILKTDGAGARLVFAPNDFASALADSEAENLVKVKITSLPANGTLRLSGTPVALGQEILADNLNSLSFVPNSSWMGATSFGWNGHDGNSYALSPATVNISVGLDYLYIPLLRR